MKVVWLSAVRTGRLYPTPPPPPKEISLVLISFRGLSDSSTIVLQEGLCQ
jgi:hypothetical protein